MGRLGARLRAVRVGVGGPVAFPMCEGDSPKVRLTSEVEVMLGRVSDAISRV